MITIEQITRSIQTHWRDQFPLATTIVFPGQQLDSAEHTAWLEVWVDSWDEPVRREAAPQEFIVAVTVHCFSRDPAAMTEVHALADAARSTLARQLIPVLDFSLSGTPAAGHARMREAEVRDLTRAHEECRNSLRHLVVTIAGFARESTS